MSGKIKVLMFGWEFPPFNSGGLGTACFGLTKALSEKNLDITFVLPKKIDVKSDRIHLAFADTFLPNVSIHILNSLLAPYIDATSYEKLRRGAGEIYGLGLLEEVKLYAARARELAEKGGFDVIHAHDWLSFGAGLAAKEVSGKPLIVHAHAAEFDRTGGHGVNQETYEMEKRGMEEADRVVTVSEFTRRLVIDRYGILPSKVSVVHNGIDETDKSPVRDDLGLKSLKKRGKKIVLYAGRITLQKGVDYLVRSAAKVLDYYPDVYFVIAGSGDMQPQIVRLSGDLGISDRIIFAGFLRGAELDAVYRAADLFVMPSVSEPFGLTALEAISNDTPVLMSKQSGVSEVVRHAIKVDFWDVDEMANKIVALLYHDSLRNTMLANAKKELPSASWASAADKCESIYRDAVSYFRVK